MKSKIRTESTVPAGILLSGYSWCSIQLINISNKITFKLVLMWIYVYMYFILSFSRWKYFHLRVEIFPPKVWRLNHLIYRVEFSTLWVETTHRISTFWLRWKLYTVVKGWKIFHPRVGKTDHPFGWNYPSWFLTVYMKSSIRTESTVPPGILLSG